VSSNVTETPALRITADADGSTAVLRLAGELDLATADLLREHVHRLVRGGGQPLRLVFDMAGLEFMDVTGLGALLEARRKVAAIGGSVAITRPRPMVVRMLGLLQLEDALQIDD
jgi:anti-sigma B factor antagonist